MNVKVIRMNTGEEVIVTVLNEDEKTIEIENPLVGMPSATGQIGFGPWAPLVKNGDSITIEKSYIVYIAEAQVDVVEQYEKIFSVIQKPSKKLIV